MASPSSSGTLVESSSTVSLSCTETSFDSKVTTDSKPTTTEQDLDSKPLTTELDLDSKPVTTEEDLDSKPVTTEQDLDSKPVTTEQDLNSKPVTTEQDLDSKPVTTEQDLDSKSVTTDAGLDAKPEADTDIDSVATVADPAASIKNVYQFKIALKRIKPKIWRRIQVPEDYSFWDFHVAIQDVMGWNGYHLHQFEMRNPKTGSTDVIGRPYGPEGIGLDPIIPEEKALISEYFTSSNNKADYDYDLGDTWNHEILFEKILPVAARTKYPRCISGKRATPLEEVCDDDDEFEVRSDDFNPKTVTFSDPAKRMKL